MRKIFNVGTLIIVAVQIPFFLTAAPAIAISVDLAKKCREMAIKAHPPAPAGTKPYAQAERAFFSQCVSNNGQMPATNPQKNSHSDMH